MNTHATSGTRSANTKLAAALTALGIGLQPDPFECIVDQASGRERTFWLFEAVSPCGRFKTADMVNAWHDESWHLANPEHPFAYIKCALNNREMLVDKCKTKVPLIEIRRNGKILILPANAPQSLIDKFQKEI